MQNPKHGLGALSINTKQGKLLFQMKKKGKQKGGSLKGNVDGRRNGRARAKANQNPPTHIKARASLPFASTLFFLLLRHRISYLLHSQNARSYYDWPLQARRDSLGAASVDHLCKSIVLVNTQAPSNVVDCSDRNNSKYYVVVVQYTARFNAETVKSFLYSLNEGKIAKKKFNLRLAPEETSVNLTGYEHNAVTCVGMNTDIPVILDEAITKLNPGFFWLGGGEVDLKLGINTSEFINFVNPFIVSCSDS